MEYTLKQKIYMACKEQLEQKVIMLQALLQELSESNAGENKSSAGDKHETARAMVHLEQEKTGQQLQQTLVQLEELGKIDPGLSSSRIRNGSLIHTNQGYIFLGLALGKIKVDATPVVVLSLHSPLGSQLSRSVTGDKVVAGAVSYEIQKVE